MRDIASYNEESFHLSCIYEERQTMPVFLITKCVSHFHHFPSLLCKIAREMCYNVKSTVCIQTGMINYMKSFCHLGSWVRPVVANLQYKHYFGIFESIRWPFWMVRRNWKGAGKGLLLPLLAPSSLCWTPTPISLLITAMTWDHFAKNLSKICPLCSICWFSSAFTE